MKNSTCFIIISLIIITFNFKTITSNTSNPSTISTCGPELIFNFITDSCVDNETALRISKRPSCKNISLPRNFVIFEKGRLIVTGSEENVSTDKYTIQKDNSISFCYPLTPKFRACQRWGLDPDEFQLENAGLILRMTLTNAAISAGDFIINEAKIGVVCQSYSDQKFFVTDAYAMAWIISAASLLVSLIIYAITNRNFNYQTKTMMCHMMSLFVFYSLLSFRLFWGSVLDDSSVCPWYSVFVHYFFLASFFWINVLAFDIWKNLPRLVVMAMTPARDRKRFIYMSAYAWGVPVVIAVSAILTDVFGPLETAFRPQFERNCWFISIESKMIFLYGPAAVVVGSNMIFYGLTVRNLKRLSRDTAMANTKIHSQLIKTYMKLLIVMGLCWIMEIFSGIFDKDNRYWYFTDIINGLQGFFLFVVYVCKPNVLRDLLALWIKHVGIGSRLCPNVTTVNSPPFRRNSKVDRVESMTMSLPMNSRAFNRSPLPA